MAEEDYQGKSKTFADDRLRIDKLKYNFDGRKFGNRYAVDIRCARSWYSNGSSVNLIKTAL